jgi:hypothetical protein
MGISTERNGIYFNGAAIIPTSKLYQAKLA